MFIIVRISASDDSMNKLLQNKTVNSICDYMGFSFFSYFGDLDTL
jgi:hypothetical protein